MKKIKTNWAVSAVAITMLLLATGCAASGPQAPLNAFEQAFLTPVSTNVTVTTNLVPSTNSVVSTNGLTVTNGAGVVSPVLVTNFVPVLLPQTVTNVNIGYAPSAQATNTVQAVGTIVNTVAPGMGTILSATIAGILAIWGTWRSRQATTATNIAANGVQAIEAARNVLASLPNGAAYSAAYDNWLKAHQADADLATEIASMVDNIVNTKTGQSAGIGAATQILQAATTPAAPVVAVKA